MNNSLFDINNNGEASILLNAFRSIYPMMISVDLTKSEYHIIEAGSFKDEKSGDTGAYDDLIKKLVNHIPYKPHKSKFNYTFSSDFLLKELKAGQTEVSLRHRYSDNNNPSYWMETKIIFINGRKDMAVLLSREIDTEMRQINEMKRDSLFKKAIFSEDALIVFECNLSINMVTSEIYSVINGVEYIKTIEMGLTPPFTLSEIGKKIWVSDHLKSDFYQQISCEYLISLYENGNCTPEFIFWKNEPNGTETCLKNTFYITKNEETGNILAYSVLKDITNSKLEQESNFQDKIMYDHDTENYECIFSLDFKSNQITVYQSINQFENSDYLRQSCTDFIKNYKSIVNHFVYEDDRKHVYRMFKKSKMMREMKKNTVFCVNFRMLLNGEPKHYQAKIIRAIDDKKAEHLAIAIHNIDEQIHEKAERIKHVQAQQINEMKYSTSENIVSNDFEAICYVNLDNDESIMYCSNSAQNRHLPDINNYNSFDDYFKYYAENYVCSDDKEEFLKAISKKKIISELEKSSIYYVNYRVRIKNQQLYYRIKIMKDNLIAGRNSIIIGIQNVDFIVKHDIDQKNILDALAKNDRNFQAAIFSDAVGFIDCNLSQDIITSDVYELVSGDYKIVSDMIDMPRPFNFNKFFLNYVKTHNVPNPNEIIEYINCENLIDLYYKGVHMPEITFWGTTPTGIMICNRLIFLLTKDEKTGEILAMVVIKDVTKSQKQKEKLKKDDEMLEILASEYSSLYLINMSDLSVTPYNIDYDVDRLFGDDIRNGNVDYYDIVNLYLETIVYEEDIDYVQQITSIDYIKEQFKTAKSFIATPRKYSNGEVKYYEMRFIKVGDSPDPSSFIIGLLDKNNQIKSDQDRQKQVKYAMERAETANKAKSAFLFNMSHDIRTPMNAIIGFTTMAQKYVGNKERVNDCLEKIKISGTHLLQLINNVLDMARIESGKVSIEEIASNITDDFEEIMLIMHEFAKNHNIKLITSKNNITNEHVYADILHFNQILINVISNAIKFTHPGGTVTVAMNQLESEKENLASYEFVIEDTGIGMGKEFQKHIFESFIRERSTTTSGVQGTGLGMPIAKQLAELMGGSITVDSKLGVGTIVKINISFRIQKKVPEKIENHPKYTDLSLKGIRILLVEDNELNREIAKDILEEADIIVDEAEDGTIAVEKISNSKPGYYDIVLMDIQMPNMDGYQATQVIRSLDNQELADIPIVAMTANAFEEDKNKALESGMNLHLAKPINIGELFEALRIFCKKK